MANDLVFLPAKKSDLAALLEIESQCFQSDRISKRSFKHWMTQEDAVFLVAHSGESVAGYGLVIGHRGTSLARLYSLAVSPNFQGHGIAAKLLTELEQQSLAAGRLYLRLEVAKKNTGAIALYKKLGYTEFGEYQDYYEDHDDALRMQKSIWKQRTLTPAQPLPWVMQTTDFTCGPASLMMAMAHHQTEPEPSAEEELDIWRTATTIFMTSGHGGTHPFGLALAARARGFDVHVRVNSEQPLFVEGVRTEHKKEVMTLVHNRFLTQANEQQVAIVYEAPTLDWIEQQLAISASVIVLISTFQLDRKKAPHWVAITHMDEQFIYVHDPDVGEHQTPLDCQHVPIARAQFDSMSAFGKDKLRTAISISRSDVAAG